MMEWAVALAFLIFMTGIGIVAYDICRREK